MPRAAGITPGQFAVAWVLNNRLVTAVIGGPRTEEQWDDYLKALDYRFTAEDEALIDRLVRRPSLDARLQRSRLSDRGPVTANIQLGVGAVDLYGSCRNETGQSLPRTARFGAITIKSLKRLVGPAGLEPATRPL